MKTNEQDAIRGGWSIKKQKNDESGIRTHALSDQIRKVKPESLDTLVWRLRPLGHLTLRNKVQELPISLIPFLPPETSASDAVERAWP